MRELPSDLQAFIFKKMTPANFITLFRLAMIPLVVALLFSGYRYASFGMLLLVLLGDLADGVIARVRKEVTDLGKVLDPIADKLLFASLFFSFAFLGDISWVAFWLLGAQQLAFLIGTLWFYRSAMRKVPPARLMGKAASSVISIGVVLTFFKPPLYQEIIYAGIVLSYLASVDYLMIALRRA